MAKDLRKKIYVLDKNRSVVEEYISLAEFCKEHSLRTDVVSKRINKLRDGWYKDGLVVRYETNIDKKGHDVRDKRASRPRPQGEGYRQALKEDLRQSLVRLELIEEKRNNYYLGVFEETNEEYNWLLNHIAVLKNRLNYKWLHYNKEDSPKAYSVKYSTEIND